MDHHIIASHHDRVQRSERQKFHDEWQLKMLKEMEKLAKELEKPLSFPAHHPRPFNYRLHDRLRTDWRLFPARSIVSDRSFCIRIIGVG